MLNWAVSREWLFIGYVANALFFMFVLGFAVCLIDEDILTAIEQHISNTPMLLSVAFACAATLVFGGATCSFERAGLLSIEPSAALGDTCASHYADLYLWHLLDAVPLIRFHQTVDMPLRYNSPDAAFDWLVLTFKVLVIVPVLGSFAAWSQVKIARLVRQRMANSHG